MKNAKNSRKYIEIVIIAAIVLFVSFGIGGNAKAQLDVKCQASPSPAYTNQTVNFIVSTSGGTGPYSYIWGGDCYGGNSPVCSAVFPSPRFYTASLTVVSGYGNQQEFINTSCVVQVLSPSCSNHSYKSCYNNNVYWYDSCGNRQEQYQDCGAINTCQNAQCQSPDNSFTVSCAASPATAGIGQKINFSAFVSKNTSNNNIYQPYTYRWNGDCSGESSICEKTFTLPGIYTANLIVSYAGLSKSASCSATINQSNRSLACSGNSLYWYDQILGQQEKFQDCGTDSCVDSGAYFCSGNNVFAKQVCYKRGCANSSCYSNVTYDSVRLVQNCDSNQTCQNGQCSYASTSPLYTTPAPSNSNPSNNYNYSNSNSSNYSNLRVSCYAYPVSAQINQTINFYSRVFGGTGNYSYAWTSACSGSSASCLNSFDSPGNKTAYLTVASGSQTSSAYCSAYVMPGSGSGSAPSVSLASVPSNLLVTLLAKKSSGQEQWTKDMTIAPKQNFDFMAVVSNETGSDIDNVNLNVVLPKEITYNGNLKIDGSSSSADIQSGVNLGIMPSKSVKTITFSAKTTASEGEFSATSTAKSESISATDSLKIDVSKSRVQLAGIGGAISNLFNSKGYALPLLVISTIIILAVVVRAAYMSLMKT